MYYLRHFLALSIIFPCNCVEYQKIKWKITIQNLRVRQSLDDGPRQRYLGPQGETALAPSICLTLAEMGVSGLIHFLVYDIYWYLGCSYGSFYSLYLSVLYIINFLCSLQDFFGAPAGVQSVMA
jgi:hypothetical protein